MMELYILRHAIAVEHGTKGYKDDTQRPLTAKGERKMRRIAKGMKKLGLSFDLILSSRLIRARQTAQIVAETFEIVKRLKFSAHLAPNGEAEELVRDLKRRYPNQNSVVLVGHEPYLSGLMATLLTGKPALDVNFKKGGLCLLTVDSLRFGHCATLQWLLTPGQLSRMR